MSGIENRLLENRKRRWGAMGFFRATAANVALFVGVALLTVGGSRAVEAAEVEKLNICYCGGALAIPQLLSGDPQIVQGSGPAAVLSRLSGSDVTMIGTTINVIPMSLITTQDIASPQDLKGKT